MPDNLSPVELQEIIDTHRGLFGGFTMMADKAPETPDPQASPADEAPETPDPQAAPADESLQAALTAERQARVTLEAQLTQFKTGLAAALGVEEAKATPEQLAEQLAAAQAETATSRVQLALYKAAPAGVDVAALLDSTSFTRSLTGIDPTDIDAITAKVTSFVEANPRFRTINPGAGFNDTHAGSADPKQPVGVNELLRAAAGR